MENFKLFLLFIKIGLMRQMAYRPHFFMMVMGKIIRILLLFFFFQAIFIKIDRLGQWTYEQVLLLFTTFHLVDFLMSITFQRNLIQFFPRWVQTGELDRRLLLPVNHLFLISFENIDLMDLFSFLPSLAFLGYILFKIGINFTWTQFFVYICLIINALIFLYAIHLIIATTSFWTTQSYGLGRILDNLFKIGRYPLDIFDSFWKNFFIYFFPLIVIAQLPTQTALQNISLKTVIWGISFVIGLLFLSIKFWKIGLKNYLSASA
ncbi:MAG: ABC transporter permease [Thermodesulfobacteriota bacterium]